MVSVLLPRVSTRPINVPLSRGFENSLISTAMVFPTVEYCGGGWKWLAR
jgi:hypothetical protein